MMSEHETHAVQNMDELTRLEALREAADRRLLVLERGAVLVIDPAELLQHLRVVRVLVEHTLIGFLCAAEL
jgi:hypothetical protein